MGKMLKRILLFLGLPIMALGLVIGFIIFLRAPNEIHISLSDSADPSGSSASQSAGGSTDTPPSDTLPTDAPPSDASDTGAGDSGSAPQSSASPAPVGSVGGSDPIAAATHWLTNYRSVSWADPSPTAWLDRLAPYITPQLRDEYEHSPTGGPTGDWDAFVAGKCESTVEDVTGAIPADLANAPNETQVNISGTLVTTCAATAAPDPESATTAVVSVTMVEPGRWLVAEQVS